MPFAKRNAKVRELLFYTGEDIKDVCEELGISVSHMAREIGIHPVTLFGYIAGRAEAPRTVMAAAHWVRDEYLKGKK